MGDMADGLRLFANIRTVLDQAGVNILDYAWPEGLA
jgi:hypothetical protein